MRPLLFVKYIDTVMQFLALIGTAIVMHNDTGLLAGWVALGAAQVISCIINLVGLDKKYRSKSRRAYEVIIGVFLVACIPLLMNQHYHMYNSPLMKATQGILYTTVIASPALAIWYIIMGFVEIKTITESDENDTVS